VQSKIVISKDACKVKDGHRRVRFVIVLQAASAEAALSLTRTDRTWRCLPKDVLESQELSQSKSVVLSIIAIVNTTRYCHVTRVNYICNQPATYVFA